MKANRSTPAIFLHIIPEYGFQPNSYIFYFRWECPLNAIIYLFLVIGAIFVYRTLFRTC